MDIRRKGVLSLQKKLNASLTVPEATSKLCAALLVLPAIFFDSLDGRYYFVPFNTGGCANMGWCVWRG